jgi:hypothetical protein
MKNGRGGNWEKGGERERGDDQSDLAFTMQQASC